MEAVPLTYLDTHVALWLYAHADEGLSPSARKALESAEALRISPKETAVFSHRRTQTHTDREKHSGRRGRQKRLCPSAWVCG